MGVGAVWCGGADAIPRGMIENDGAIYGQFVKIMGGPTQLIGIYTAMHKHQKEMHICRSI